MTRRKRQIQNLAENLRQAGDLDNVAHFEPRRETVGDLLRRARVGKSQEIAEVATRLRIRPGYLKAIEDGRFQDLPGLTYAVGFVRTYADHLGLDAEDVVRRFRDEVTELKSQTQLIFPVVAAEGKIPRGAVLLLSAVLAAIAYGGWYYLSEREQSPLDLIPALPERLQQLISGDEAPAPDAAPVALSGATSSTSTGAAPAATAGAAPGPAVPPAPAATVPAAPAPAATTATAPAADPAAPSAPALPVPATDTTAATQQGATTTAPADGQLAAVPPAVPEATVPAPAVQAPATGTTAAPAPGATAATGTVPPPAAAAPGAPAAPAPGLDSSGLPTVAAPAAPASPAIPGVTAPSDAATLPPVADGQVFGATEGAPSRIVLVARLESWIQVTDPETNALLTRVLRAGDRYYVPDQAGLTLATGNAGGLDIWVDGGKVPTLGPVGVVRRGIVLDPARLQTGTALAE